MQSGVVVGAATLGLNACGGGTGSGDSVKIGLLLPLSGVYANIAKELENGSDLYLEEHGGKLGGMGVEVVSADTELDPGQALLQTRRLVTKERVDVLMGIVTGSEMLAIRDFVDSSKVLCFDTNASPNALTTEQRSEYIFRTSFSGWQDGYTAGYQSREEFPDQRVVVLAPDYVAGQEYVDAFKQGFEGEILQELYPPLGTKDYAPFLSRVRAANPDFVYAFFAGSDAVAFVTQYASFGLRGKIPLTGAQFLVEESILPAIGDAAVGIKTNGTYYPTLKNAANEKFVAAYEKSYKHVPTNYAEHQYDAMAFLDKALDEVGSKDVAKLVRALEGMKLDSPRGEIELDASSHEIVQNFYYATTEKQDGELVNQVTGEILRVGAVGKVYGGSTSS